MAAAVLKKLLNREVAEAAGESSVDILSRNYEWYIANDNARTFIDMIKLLASSKRLIAAKLLS